MLLEGSRFSKLFFGVYHDSNLLEFSSICILNLFYLGKLVIFLRSIFGSLHFIRTDSVSYGMMFVFFWKYNAYVFARNVNCF